jgi:hypothetical protein
VTRSFRWRTDSVTTFSECGICFGRY